MLVRQAGGFGGVQGQPIMHMPHPEFLNVLQVINFQCECPLFRDKIQFSLYKDGGSVAIIVALSRADANPCCKYESASCCVDVH
jgi:hypothetical protein